MERSYNLWFMIPLDHKVKGKQQCEYNSTKIVDVFTYNHNIIVMHNKNFNYVMLERIKLSLDGKIKMLQIKY